ncbi:hypothetical protein H5410_031528 [Solanum commersonii]|uniref:Uncharacterized protein n=1 Tax=Solanum commersonii TaxID=4109 RepID=A0A9J5YMM5_SOLCO|nr:hypothetical protein H5410_031528 [Solanum commersonii]
MATVIASSGGNLTSIVFEEFSQIDFNLGEFEDSMISPILMNVNILMADLISMDKKSFTPIEVEFSKKTFEGSLETDDNHKENEYYDWTLVTHKKQRHQIVVRIQLSKTRALRSDRIQKSIILRELYPECLFKAVKLVLTLLEESDYDFSNLAILKELKDESLKYVSECLNEVEEARALCHHS